MRRATILSIGLIMLGLLLECLHLTTDIRFFQIKLWILGLVFIVAGLIGLKWYAIVPILEERAKTLGRFKRKSGRR